MMLRTKIIIVGTLCFVLAGAEAEAAIAETRALLGGGALLAWTAGLVLGCTGLIGSGIILGRYVINGTVGAATATILLLGSIACYFGAREPRAFRSHPADLK